jgi:hypothetical protein
METIVDIGNCVVIAEEVGNCTFRQGLEYVFLSAGKFMPGMEKLAGELFFPTNQQLFLTTVGSKNSWF